MRPFLATMALLLLTSPALAEESSPSNAEVTSSSSTIQALVDDVAQQAGRLITDLPRPRMDMLVLLHGALPQRAGASHTLGDELERLLLATISREHPLRSVRGAEGASYPRSTSARAAAGQQGYELLLWLETTLVNNHIVLEGWVYETEHHLWREAVAPERQVLGRVFARARVDAELRRYLPPIAPRPLSLNEHSLGRRRYLAMAVADLDGDDLNELVLLSARRVEIRRLSETETVLIGRLPLAGAPRAPTRSRDPVGSIVVGPRGEDGLRPFAFRTTEHSQGFIARFDGSELTLGDTLSDFPIRWVDELECATIASGRSEYQTAATPCGSFETSPVVEPYWALGSTPLPQPDGPPATATVTALANGTVVIRWRDRVVGREANHGTALALTDADDDGAAELLLASDSEPNAPDELTVLRFDARGVREERQRFPDISGSVWIATAGDVDNDGLRELLAIAQAPTGAQLLVVE